jgi:hypothetical protein
MNHVDVYNVQARVVVDLYGVTTGVQAADLSHFI